MRHCSATGKGSTIAITVLLLAALLLSTSCASRQIEELSFSDPVSSSASFTDFDESSIETKLDVVEVARSNIGVRYKFGGTSPQTGFDCSGLVFWSYQQVGVTLPRRARDQLKFGINVDDKSQLQPGDIVVFKGTNSRTGWHSGIYTGDGMFIHSRSRDKTVTESKIRQAYYAKHFAGARRILRHDSQRTQAVSP